MKDFIALIIILSIVFSCTQEAIVVQNCLRT